MDFRRWAALALLVSLCICISAILYPVILAARPVALQTRSLSNMRMLSTAWIIYASERDDVSCPATNWNELIQPYLRDQDTILDPLLNDEDEQRGYGYNPLLASTDLVRVEELEKVVAFGLTQLPGKDAQISANTIRVFDNQKKLTHVSFVNCQVETVSTNAMDFAIWRPKLDKPVPK